ncbi:MAG: hypothetical protein P4L73_04710 [Caulobacteraceae bacterium]|nr:hypothetical protein [Caulobacteraceae bacterium]
MGGWGKARRSGLAFLGLLLLGERAAEPAAFQTIRRPVTRGMS